ncbi:hypothetical protein ASG59_18605 [Methylobacterium sp. Leaf466]|nr:hypothetical protein ASG59_18605 [Methylobacterium sp. Leaf466]
MMPIDMVTYAVVGVIDNDDKPLEYTCQKTGKVRKRQKNLRYKLSIDAWVLPAHHIQKKNGGQFSRNVQLRKATSFENKIIDVNESKGTFSETFVHELRDRIALNDPEDLYGVISDHDGGFNYFERQYVHVTFTADEDGNLMPVATIYVDGQKLVADAMTSLFITPKQKAMGLVAQQFVDRCGYAARRKSQTAQKATRTASGGSKA